MKSFNQFITEREQRFAKGWVSKDKIVFATSDYDLYHIKQVMKYARKFGLNKKKILEILEDSAEDMSAPDPKQYAEDQWDAIVAGVIDNDVYIEEYLKKKGYCMFVIDKAHGSVGGWDEKSAKVSAKILDDIYLPFEKDGFKMIEIKTVRGRDKYITSKYDWYEWLGGKKSGGNRSEIGSTMAQFREASDSYPTSYEKHPLLNRLVDKHSDPLKFVLDVITQMSKGKLKLRRIGVANTREVVAFWNSKKQRQIKPSYVMEQLEMLGELNDVDEGEKLEALWQKFLKKIKMRPFDRKERARTKEQRNAILKWNKLMGIGASYDVDTRK